MSHVKPAARLGDAAAARSIGSAVDRSLDGALRRRRRNRHHRGRNRRPGVARTGRRLTERDPVARRVVDRDRRRADRGHRPWRRPVQRIVGLAAGATADAAGCWSRSPSRASAGPALGTGDACAGTPGREPTLAVFVGGAVGLGAGMGAVLGAAQAWVLRPQVPHPWRWVTANMVAWAVAMPIIFAGANLPGADWPLPAVAASGTITGLMAGAALGLVSGAAAPVSGRRSGLRPGGSDACSRPRFTVCSIGP